MSYRCRVKICGVCRPEDVDLVSASGADFVGLLVNMPSTRTLDPDGAARLAARASIPVALLFMDSPVDFVARVAGDIRPAVAQLQGHEPPEYVAELRAMIPGAEIWKAVHLPATGSGEADFDSILQSIKSYSDAGADRLLLDTVVMVGGKKEMGGTGKTYDWETAARLAATSPRPVLMAGGLSPANVAEAIQKVRPWAVDLASGVESERGVKDPAKVSAFMKAVKSCTVDV